MRKTKRIRPHEDLGSISSMEVREDGGGPTMVLLQSLTRAAFSDTASKDLSARLLLLIHKLP